MIARFAALASCVLLATGCDLEEAERLDLTRGSSRSLQPRLDGIAIDGSTDLVLTRVLSSLWDPQGSQRWSLALTDLLPDSRLPLRWAVVGELDGNVVLGLEGSGTRATSSWTDGGCSWTERAGELRLRLDSLDPRDGTWRTWLPLEQRIRDDRPQASLERTFSFSPGEILGRGDTLFVAVRNTDVNPVAVYSDFSGVRQIGAYELLVPPGGRDTLRWLVTDAPSDDRWIDLGWGDWGHHEKRSFRAP